MNTPNPTGIQLPDFLDDPTQRKFGLENLPSDRTSGYASGAVASYSESVLGQAFSLPVNYAFEKFAPGKFLTPDEWKQSPHFRPGLNFPNGVGENVARLKAADFDAQQERYATIEGMPDGLLTSLTKLAAGATGFALGTPFLGVAAGTIGRASSPILAGLAETGTAGRFAAKAAEGAAIGGGITAPQEALHLINSSLYGEDYTPLEAITNIGLNAGLGGLIHMGVEGFRAKPFQTITTAADRAAKESAVSQMAEGKSVDVEPVIKQGFADARAADGEGYRREVEESLADIRKSIAEKSSLLEQETKTLDSSFREFTKFGELRSDETFSAIDIARNTLELEKISPADRTLADNLFLKTAQQSEEVALAIDALRKPAFERDANERILLNALEKGREPELIKSRLEAIDERLQEIEDSLEATKSKRKAESLTKEREGLLTAKEVAEERIKSLEVKPEKSSIKDQQTKVDNIRQELAELNELKNNHEAALEALNKPIEPQTKEDIKTHAKKMDDIAQDSAIDISAIDAFERDAEAIPEDVEQLLPALEEQVKDLEAKEALTKEEKAILDETKEYEGRAKKLKDVIKSAIDCLVTK